MESDTYLVRSYQDERTIFHFTRQRGRIWEYQFNTIAAEITQWCFETLPEEGGWRIVTAVENFLTRFSNQGLLVYVSDPDTALVCDLAWAGYPRQEYS